MWAIRVIHCGIAPNDVWTTGTGNNFAQMLHNKTRKGWRMETEQMRKLIGRIYVVPDFTQKIMLNFPVFSQLALTWNVISHVTSARKTKFARLYGT